MFGSSYQECTGKTNEAVDRTNTDKTMGKEVISCNSDLLKSFKGYAAELDQEHDRFERLVKLSRDVNIESKRIIFLLHSIGRGREEKQVLEEAENRLGNLVKNSLHQIGKELQSQDPYKFHRAFTCGFQEFMEAYTFFLYIKDKNLKHWDYFQNLLKYKVKCPTDGGSDPEGNLQELITPLAPIDYVLGVADLTGELMSKCVYSLERGDTDVCFQTCEIVRKLYAGFLIISSCKHKEFPKKMSTLKCSLLKMERVCYNITLRRNEMPQHMFIHSLSDYEHPEREY